LRSASAISANDVWAVGTGFPEERSIDSVPVVHHWDGRQWSDVPAPAPTGSSLDAVAAVSEDDVWAVGDQLAPPLVIHWDGNRWNGVEVPATRPEMRRQGGFEAIAALGPNDVWILGHNISAGPAGASVSIDVFDHWDGDTWTLHRGPEAVDPAVGTYGIQAIDAGPPGEVWAGGGRLQGFGEAGRPAGALLERWDGQAWTQLTAPDGDGSISQIAVAGQDDIWVVQGGTLVTDGFHGTGEETLRHWNGSAWSEPFPVGGSIAGLVARGPDDAWAVGTVGEAQSSEPLVLHWDGRRWREIETEPPPAITGGLTAVTLTDRGEVIAFGSDYPAEFGGGDIDQSNRPKSYLWMDCG
jgi:hypothetical protein